MSVTFADMFCGAGGSSIGLTEAGLELVIGLNHWERAIDTHSRNFPNAEHLCADVNNIDMRRLPRSDVLWASPICTELSPSGGNSGGVKRRNEIPGEEPLEIFGPIEQAGFERTRATFYDVIRATEVHAYKYVLIENVPEAAWKWKLFTWFLQGMTIALPYTLQIVCVDSAHVGGTGNPFAPQWRKRMYLVLSRSDMPVPDVQITPWAWCDRCGTDVQAVQWWKPKTRRYLGHLVGKYGQQYQYQCPKGHAFVEPYVLPAATAIDWTDPGKRIGDKTKPLAANTLARIRAGLELVQEPALITVNHSDGDHRAVPLARAPMPARTVKIGEAIAGHPLLVPCGGSYYKTAMRVDQPFRPRLTRETEAVVTSPGSFLVEMRNHQGATPITNPFAPLGTSGNHNVLVNLPDGPDPRGSDPSALVIPYRRGNRPATTDEPLLTMATKDPAAIVRPDIRIEDCWMRMLSPREQLRAQRFPDSYVVTGNRGEQTMQAGNAVSANVANFLGSAVLAAMTRS